MYLVARPGLALLGAGSGPLDQALNLAAVGGTSLVAYLATALLLKTEELGTAVSLLRGAKDIGGRI